MSIDNIKLTPFLMERFYKNCLIEFDLLEELSESSPTLSLNILGNNRSRVALILENDDQLYLPDDQLNFLLGILSACNLNMEDVAIINLKNHKTANYKTIKTELNAKYVILLGVTTSQLRLPVDFPLYQIQNYNGQTYLAAGMLHQLKDSNSEKNKLWVCLKEMFAI